MPVNIDDALPSFIADFSPSLPRAGREIASRLETYGWESVYEAMLGVWSAAEDAGHIEGCCRFVSYFLSQQGSIPVESAEEFRERLFDDEELKGKIIAKFRFIDRYRARSAIFNHLFTVEDFFDSVRFREIEDVVVESEWLLIKNFLFVASLALEGEMDRVIERVLDSGNRYLLWGTLDYYGETLDATIEDHLDRFEEVEDVVVRERLRYLLMKIEIRNLMYDEGRLDYSDEEAGKLARNLLPFNKFILEMQKTLKDGRCEAATLDSVARRMWAGAE
jgi:hypothetical protein